MKGGCLNIEIIGSKLKETKEERTNLNLSYEIDPNYIDAAGFMLTRNITCCVEEDTRFF